MSTILAKIKQEPAMVVTAVTALIGLAIAFGVDLTVEQQGAIVAVVTVIAGVFIRQNVTPTP